MKNISAIHSVPPMPTLSVIICTHNPKIQLLREVLNALKTQTLDPSTWALLIVDNASGKPLQNQLDLSWHPQAKVVSEEILGLTHARLRGIQEQPSDIFVYVDDDNILQNDYLANVIQIADSYPWLGAWGGNLIPRYECKPPDWFYHYSHLVAIRKISCDKWCNIPDWMIGACPSGAGICIRSCVAEKYFEHCTQDPIRKRLDRVGSSLMGCGDLDLAFTACDIGLGTGVFCRLSLTHVIPRERFDMSYLLRIEEGNAASSLILEYLRNRGNPQHTSQNHKRSILGKVMSKLNAILKKEGNNKDFAEEFRRARERGNQAGLAMLTINEFKAGKM